MPAFLENRLKSEYGADSKIPFKIMNSLGAMRGNKETALGRAMALKHTRDQGRTKPPAARGHSKGDLRKAILDKIGPGMAEDTPGNTTVAGVQK